MLAVFEGDEDPEAWSNETRPLADRLGGAL